MPLYLVIDIAKLVNCWELSLRQSAAKPQYEEGSTTIPKASTLKQVEMPAIPCG